MRVRKPCRTGHRHSVPSIHTAASACSGRAEWVHTEQLVPRWSLPTRNARSSFPDTGQLPSGAVYALGFPVETPAPPQGSILPTLTPGLRTQALTHFNSSSKSRVALTDVCIHKQACFRCLPSGEMKSVFSPKDQPQVVVIGLSQSQGPQESASWERESSDLGLGTDGLNPALLLELHILQDSHIQAMCQCPHSEMPECSHLPLLCSLHHSLLP